MTLSVLYFKNVFFRHIFTPALCPVTAVQAAVILYNTESFSADTTKLRTIEYEEYQ